MDICFNNTPIGSITGQYSAPLPNKIDYYTFHRVNDEVRGYLVYNGTWTFVPPSSVQSYYDIEKLALILESPHKSEYQRNSFIPLGPARGETGENIERLLVNRPWIKWLNKQIAYEIYLMNAIQYQCSAWNYISGFSKLDEKLRNDIFEKMWKKFAKKEFKQRINDYSPDIIVNCCTGGFNYYTISSKTKRIIKGKQSNALFNVPSGLNGKIDSALQKYGSYQFKFNNKSITAARRCLEFGKNKKRKIVYYYYDYHPIRW